MAWTNEVILPWTPVGQLYFSPISNDQVYVIDNGTNFWLYDIANRQWTELTSPNFTSTTSGLIDRSLAPSPNGTKLACISEATANYRGGKRIEVYTIATDTWAASSQVQDMDNEIPVLRPTVIAGLVWADEDTIWCWASEAIAGVKDYARCISYTISIDTFTIFPTLLNGTLATSSPRSAAINAAGTIIYGSVIGVAVAQWYQYTIAADAYALGGALTAGRAFAFATDTDKLWYFDTTSDYRQGYVDIADGSEHDNQFEVNPDRDPAYGWYFGVKDTLGGIIVYARATPPRLMTTGGFLPLAQTLPATGVT